MNNMALHVGANQKVAVKENPTALILSHKENGHRHTDDGKFEHF